MRSGRSSGFKGRGDLSELAVNERSKIQAILVLRFLESEQDLNDPRRKDSQSMLELQ